MLFVVHCFCSSRRSKNDILLEQVSDFLQQLPNQFCPVDYLKKQLVSISMCIVLFMFYYHLECSWSVFFFCFQNMNEKTLKRVFSCFRFSKIVEFSQHPIEEIDPTAEPVTNKNGKIVFLFVFFFYSEASWWIGCWRFSHQSVRYRLNIICIWILKREPSNWCRLIFCIWNLLSWILSFRH